MSKFRDTTWLLLGRFISLITPLLVTPLVARILAKEEIGIWALIQVAIGFVAIFQDGGLSPYVVRHPKYDQQVRAMVLTCSILLGLLVGLALLLFSWPFCSLLGFPHHWVLFIPLVGVYGTGGLSSVLGAELRKCTRFKSLFFSTAVPHILAVPVSIALLYKGFGLWTFPLSALLTALSQLGILLFVTRPLRFGWSPLTVGEMFGYTRGILGFNLINYWARKLDDLLIGSVLGTSALAVYSNAYRLMLLPITQVISVFHPMILPYMAKKQNNLIACRKELYGFLKIIGLIVFFGMSFLWLERDFLIQIYLGPNWQEVADLLFWFAPLGMLQSIINPLGNCYMFSGKNDRFFWMGVTNTLVVITGFVAGLPFGVQGVAIAYLLTSCLMVFPSVHFAVACIEGNVMEWLKNTGHLWIIPFVSYFIHMIISPNNFISSWITSIIIVSSVSFLVIIFFDRSIIHTSFYFFKKRVYPFLSGQRFIQ